LPLEQVEFWPFCAGDGEAGGGIDPATYLDSGTPLDDGVRPKPTLLFWCVGNQQITGASGVLDLEGGSGVTSILENGVVLPSTDRTITPTSPLIRPVFCC